MTRRLRLFVCTFWQLCTIIYSFCICWPRVTFSGSLEVGGSIWVPNVGHELKTFSKIFFYFFFLLIMTDERDWSASYLDQDLIFVSDWFIILISLKIHHKVHRQDWHDDVISHKSCRRCSDWIIHCRHLIGPFVCESFPNYWEKKGKEFG